MNWSGKIDIDHNSVIDKHWILWTKILPVTQITDLVFAKIRGPNVELNCYEVCEVAKLSYQRSIKKQTSDSQEGTELRISMRILWE
ncbi:hypothetical protein ACTXT7_000142 [Hymenolepis weldensis]